MTPETVIRLLAEPDRLRVYSAIVLGERSRSAIAQASGVPVKDTAIALRRLQEGGLIEAYEQGFHARVDLFKEMAREIATRPQAEDHGSGDDHVESVLRAFIQGDRLVNFPAQWQKKIVVLQHIVARSFEPGTEYTEQAVNDRLRGWCEDAPVDHVAIRRYLVDAGLLRRENGLYWVMKQA